MFKTLLLLLFLWLIIRLGIFIFKARHYIKRTDDSSSAGGLDRSKIEDAEFVDVDEKKNEVRGE